jgi:DNA-directed RNA polymerase specialized sigma24 family protein
LDLFHVKNWVRDVGIGSAQKQITKGPVMDKLSYEGLVEQWKVDLIASRARRMGFRDDEIDDAQQRIVVELLKFKFDVKKSNGAKESTALQSLIDNQLIKICRSNGRYHAHLDHLRVGTHDGLYFENEDRRLDMQDAIEQLSEREQKVCWALSEGLSKDEIAKLLHCAWHTVERLIRRIRQYFSDLGLDGYLWA